MARHGGETHVVVPQAWMEVPKGEEEGRELEDGAEAEEGGVVVWYSQEH